MIETILLDLDGTLIDPAEGVIDAYQHTLEQLGLEPPAREKLLWVIGPPTRHNLIALLRPEHDVEHALACFRAFYETDGVRRARTYDGIEQALAHLRALPARLFVCTARPRASAEFVLQHLRLAEHIDAVYGAELDGRFEDKSELLELLLSRERVAVHSAVMVGDRASDATAAARHAIRTIAVSWGYGAREELAASGALEVCGSAEALVSVIRRMAAEP
jgi:phosphoglycolate phosphatase